MKIKKLSLITIICALSVLFVAPNAFAAGTNEVKASETLAMIQNIDKTDNTYLFDVLTDTDELTVAIDKYDVNTIYNIDSYAIGDYVSFDNLDVNADQITSDNIRLVTPYITTGSIAFMPIEPQFDIPEDDYGFDNVLEHGFNYAYGYSLMQSFNSQGLFVNANYFVRGILDVISLDTEDFFTVEELQGFVQEYQTQFQDPEVEQKSENGDETALEEINNLAKPTVLDDQFAYAYGYLIAAQFVTSGIPVDNFYFTQGILDAAYSKDSQMSQYQMENAMRDFEKEYTAKQEEYLAQLKAENLNEAETFLEANKEQSGVITLDSGVQYRVLKEGEGPKPTPTDFVSTHYEGEYYGGMKDKPNSKVKGIVLTTWYTLDYFLGYFKLAKFD